MGVTKTYSRPKATTVNSTGMALTLLVAEKPDSPVAIGGTGTTGELDMRVRCDADESGGAYVQDLFKVETLPQLSADGVITLSVTVTPIKGGGAVGTPVSMNVKHDEDMDTWQTAAGRARQA
jgi:hypothetical protein